MRTGNKFFRHKCEARSQQQRGRFGRVWCEMVMETSACQLGRLRGRDGQQRERDPRNCGKSKCARTCQQRACGLRNDVYDTHIKSCLKLSLESSLAAVGRTFDAIR